MNDNMASQQGLATDLLVQPSPGCGVEFGYTALKVRNNGTDFRYSTGSRNPGTISNGEGIA